MAAPLDVSPTEAEASPEAIISGMSAQKIEGRSLGQIAWMRLRRDKVAMGGAIFILFLAVVAIFGPYVVQNPDTLHPNLLNQTLLNPNGAFGGISVAHPLGVDPQFGRDLLARVVICSRYSLPMRVPAS